MNDETFYYINQYFDDISFMILIANDIDGAEKYQWIMMNCCMSFSHQITGLHSPQDIRRIFALRIS